MKFNSVNFVAERNENGTWKVREVMSSIIGFTVPSAELFVYKEGGKYVICERTTGLRCAVVKKQKDINMLLSPPYIEQVCLFRDREQMDTFKALIRDAWKMYHKELEEAL